MAQTLRGRFAPSPTGLAHLGNAWSFLLAWLAARQAGGEILLRMEDLDLERCSPVYMQLLMSDMRWLGLDWDEGPTPERELAAYHQSNRFPLYEEALQMLVSRGLAYPCFCSRKDVRSMASAPHVGDAGAAYPGTCRGLHPAEAARRIAKGERFSWRFRSTDRVYRFADGLYGLQERALADCGGDFSLRRSDGVFSYQLAVSVDDALMGVTQVVRGRDILPSTPRQLALLDALGLEAPSYVHIPLLLDAEGDTVLPTLRIYVRENYNCDVYELAYDRYLEQPFQSLNEFTKGAGLPKSGGLGYEGIYTKPSDNRDYPAFSLPATLIRDIYRVVCTLAVATL